MAPPEPRLLASVCVEWPNRGSGGVGQGVVGIGEVGVVKDVEELGSEAKAHPFGEVKLALQPNIRLHGSETPQHIAAKIALPVVLRGLKTESSLVEDFAAGIPRAIKNERHSGVDVGPGI